VLNSVATLPATQMLNAVNALATTAALPAVPAAPATATLPAVPALPATATLPMVPALPATATLPTTAALPATAAFRSTSETLTPPVQSAPVTLTAVTSYEISVFLHVTAVVVGFGATFAEAVMFPVAMKLDVRHLPYVHRLQLAINTWLATPGLVVVLATGFYQVADADLSMGDAWISGALAIVIVLGGLIGAYFIPEDRRLGAMVTRELAAAGPGGEVTLSEEYRRRARIEGIVGAVAGLLVVVAVYLMVVKPGL
jgi:hypothetical protein